jgi:hypothetical protein
MTYSAQERSGTQTRPLASRHLPSYALSCSTRTNANTGARLRKRLEALESAQRTAYGRLLDGTPKIDTSLGGGIAVDEDAWVLTSLWCYSAKR